MSTKTTPGHRIVTALAAGMFRPEASNHEIGLTVGVCGRTVAAHLAKLEAAGIIYIERRPPNAGGIGTDPTGRTIRLAPME